jgi:3-hydroxy-3-methylglutaryl CoA synthase
VQLGRRRCHDGREAARSCPRPRRRHPKPFFREHQRAICRSSERRRHQHRAVASEDLASVDVGASQRAGVTALIQGIAAVKSGVYQSALVVAADKRRNKAASPGELAYGDGAAAVTGNDSPLVEFVAAHSASVDFVDHFRGATETFDYAWEERWIRDEGLAKIVAPAVLKALEKAELRRPPSNIS